MNGEVGAYADLVESLARKFVGRNGAEFDDLVQEGLVNVWQSLERGVTPTAEIIDGRMQNWTRLLGYQTGRFLPKLDLSGQPIPVPYETLLPLDEFPHSSADPIPSWDALS